MKTTWGVVLGLWIGLTPAWATLGQPEESVLADQQFMQAQLHAIANEGYSVKQIEAPDGTVVREYISPAGLVFGLFWQGPKVPDLTQLLGDYFPVYQDAMQPALRRRSPAVVHSGDLTVAMWGRMRAFQGRAYLTSLMPENVSEEMIQ